MQSMRSRHLPLSKVRYFADHLPRLPQDAFVFFDAVLQDHPAFLQLKRENPRAQFVSLVAGESLKELTQLTQVYERIAVALTRLQGARPCFVSLGGGSVGDFVGFFASIYLRGVPLLHIPSTYLAALDSSHGGKTALNCLGAKNVLGSFYAANEVWLARRFLSSQPQVLLEDAYFELLKMYILSGQENKLMAQFDRYGQIQEDLFWRFLPAAVAAKYAIVRRDPFEQRGLRRYLNLGHSLGHVLEAHFSLSHGFAVGLGMDFSLRLSQDRGTLNSARFALLNQHFLELGLAFVLAQYLRELTDDDWYSLLARDKKAASGEHLQWVLLSKKGVICRKLAHSEVIRWGREAYAEF